MSTFKKVVFACVHNAGRSRMAEAFFNAMADPRLARAISAGTEPSTAVHPEVRVSMEEAGVPVDMTAPQLLTAELAAGASLLVTLGCGESCPVIPGAARLDWPVPDPEGMSRGGTREVREHVRAHVETLVRENGWLRKPKG